MTRQTWVLAGAAVAVIGVVAVASGSKDATPAARTAPANTAKVERGELSAAVSLDGILTYQARSDGSPYAVINRAAGTYTKLPEAGDKVDCGSALYRVDDTPVELLCGTVPAYRNLRIGDEGNDVRQLNRNLHVDGPVFTTKTQAALKRADFDVDDAVFLPMPVRIARVTAELGGPARPGAPVAQATSGTLDVEVNLDASQQGQVKQGDRAQITLPGNVSVTGSVDRLGRVAQAPPGQSASAGDATLPAYIGLDDAGKARGLDQAPVGVDITTTGVKSALSVPVTALVGKSGGGFAVEVVRAGGRRELVAVELGLFDTTAGRVQVEGDLDVGDHVVVPSL